VRRDGFERYGEKKLSDGGPCRDHQLDPKCRDGAQYHDAGLVNFDEALGWRLARSQTDVSGDWGPVKLADVQIAVGYLAVADGVVLETSYQSARIGFPSRPRTGRCRQ